MSEFPRTDEEREAEAVGVSSDARYCACGCGEKLAATAKRNYKRGHKLNSAIRDAGDDPEPGGDAPESTVPARAKGVRLTKRLRDELTGELTLLLAVAGMGWGIKDPMCGGALANESGNIAEKLVPIIAKSPRAVKFLTSGAGITVYIELAMALKPVGETFFAHHLMKNVPENAPQLQGDPTVNGFAFPVE